MQLICEAYQFLKEGLGLSYEEMQGLAQECLNKDTADEVLETVKTKLGE